MNDKTVNRRRFLGGVIGSIGVAGLLGLPREASGSVGGSPQRLPEGFSYAPGEPPPVQPVKAVSGVISSVDDRQIVLQVGSEAVPVPLAGKPFVWKDGVVQLRQIGSRLKVGEPATISGVTDDAGDYLDIQHVWVNLPAGVL